MNIKLAVITSLTVCSFISSARAAAYTGTAYEGFNYAPGTGITTTTLLNGGFGWNPAGDGSANTVTWGQTVPNNNNGNGITVGTGSLAFPGIGTSGEKAVLNGSTTTAIGRLFGQNIDSGSFYFSFLMQKTVATERTLNLSFFSTATGTGTPNERFAVGQIGGGVNDSDGNFAVLVSNSGVDNGLKLASSPLSLGLNSTHLVVGRLDFNLSGGTNDLLTLYIDPTLGSEPGSSYMTVSADFQVLMGFRMFAGNSSGVFTPAAQGEFDELHFGTSWTDVIAVPEPSSFAMLVCGATILLGIQRRSRLTR
jgi:hypothetical protein